MSGPLARRLRKRRLLLFGAFLATAVLLSTSVLAQRNDDDVRNQSFGLIYKGNPTQDCWKHHRPEGMADSHIVIPIFPKMIKRGEPSSLQFQVENAWKYELAEIKVQINLTDEETYLVPLVGSTAESTPPLKSAWQGSLGHPQLQPPAAGLPSAVPPYNAFHGFQVKPGAVALYAEAQFHPFDQANSAQEHQYEAVFYQPGRSVPFKFDTDAPASADRRVLTLPRGAGIDQITIPNGDWRFELRYLRGGSPTVSYSLNVTVVYQAVGDKEYNVYSQLRDPPEPPTPPKSIVPPRGVSQVIDIPILGIKEGVQRVEIKITALLYYRHQAGGTPNEDWFERYATREIVVGDQYVPSDVQASTGGVSQVDFYLMAGEVTGFAAAFLLFPSLLLGGTYGRATRKFLNDLLGGAKRRVMFHNVSSLGLTLVALVHIVFFLMEVRYTVLMGVLWGGLGLLSLLILGLTGYYQVPLIQKYGYNWWRFVHLAFGLLVVVFVAWHSVADGADFHFIREQIPEYLWKDLNLAEK